LVKFIKQSLNGDLPYYFESEKQKKIKFSKKVVGEDFTKRVFESNKDALVLIYHPNKEKNRGLKEKFD